MHIMEQGPSRKADFMEPEGSMPSSKQS